MGNTNPETVNPLTGFGPCFLRCVPPKTSHHAKRIVQVRAFRRLADTPELVASKAMLDELLLRVQPAAPVMGPVQLALMFTWPWLALGSHSLKFRSRGRVPHTSKPDLTNVAKTIEDRLVALRFIEDDRAVVDLRLTKFWGDDPGILVTIRQVGFRDV